MVPRYSEMCGCSPTSWGGCMLQPIYIIHTHTYLYINTHAYLTRYFSEVSTLVRHWFEYQPNPTYHTVPMRVTAVCSPDARFFSKITHWVIWKIFFKLRSLNLQDHTNNTIHRYHKTYTPHTPQHWKLLELLYNITKHKPHIHLNIGNYLNYCTTSQNIHPTYTSTLGTTWVTIQHHKT